MKLGPKQLAVLGAASHDYLAGDPDAPAVTFDQVYRSGTGGVERFRLYGADQREYETCTPQATRLLELGLVVRQHADWSRRPGSGWLAVTEKGRDVLAAAAPKERTL